MKNWIRSFMAIVLCATALPALALESGKPAPDFSLTDIHGKKQTLSKMKGKFVVLEWINHDCPFVKKHYNGGHMQALQKEYTGKGVEWVSICSSAKGKQGNLSAAEWVTKNEEKGGAATAILLDPSGKVGKLYVAKTTPHIYIIDPKGVLIYQGAIDDTPSTDSEDIKTSKNYVRATLDEAMAGHPVTESNTKPYGCGVKY
ncbi:MAG: thioredoxin family protein [Elusimicrobia bacterium]|mgnify:CR=1 FL=1|jgi:peroxiredoxin|nr:thioredoxin family protein [Elusimicrobiota bacterium]